MSLENKLGEVETTKKELESRYENRLSQLQLLNESHDTSEMFECQEAELEKLRARQVNMTKMIDNLEAHRQERNEEIELMRCQLEAMDELTRNNDLLETHCKTLSYQLEVERNEFKEREGKFNGEKERLRKELENVGEGRLNATAAKDQLLKEKQVIECELAATKLNMETALEDAQYMSEELERTRHIEKQGFHEKEELKSKLESAMEEKVKLEKTLHKVEEENARLKGHQNPQQKLQYLLTIKKENHALKEQVNKLIAENQKCSCKGKKAPLSNRNGGENKKDAKMRGSSSSDDGNSTEKENDFTSSL